MHRNLILLLIPIVLLVVQCMPYKEEKITEINFTLNDPVVQKVLTHQDLQLTDSLYTYFRHIDPTYRYAAAMAFASHRDPSALDSLVMLLMSSREFESAHCTSSRMMTTWEKPSRRATRAVRRVGTAARRRHPDRSSTHP